MRFSGTFASLAWRQRGFDSHSVSGLNVSVKSCLSLCVLRLSGEQPKVCDRLSFHISKTRISGVVNGGVETVTIHRVSHCFQNFILRHLSPFFLLIYSRVGISRDDDDNEPSIFNWDGKADRWACLKSGSASNIVGQKSCFPNYGGP